jgi:GT2 family glycosyltransferase
MELARGEIVAYTDDDCFADPDWLYFLVSKLLETGATGVGRPNLLPTDRRAGRVACVSASPGTPAPHPHRRQRGRARARLQHGVLGGPAARDRRLRSPSTRRRATTSTSAGGLQAEGDHIVYAPAAVVWHHRRATVKAYLKQQRGYGEARAC